MKPTKIAALAAGLAACLALSACWTSPKLLIATSDAEHPLKAGAYMNMDEQLVELRDAGHGFYAMSDGHLSKARQLKEASPLLLFALPGAAPGVYGYAGTDDKCAANHAKCKSWIYGVAKIDGDKVSEDLPLCSETTALARNHYAEVEDLKGRDDQPKCTFTSATNLKSALAEFAKTAKFTVNYQRM